MEHMDGQLYIKKVSAQKNFLNKIKISIVFFLWRDFLLI